MYYDDESTVRSGLTGPEAGLIKELSVPDPKTGCRYSCNGCYFFSFGLAEMAEHVRCIHEPKEFQCPYCKKMYASKNSYYVHISKTHRDLHAKVNKRV